MRRSRAALPLKPSLTAGLTLYAGTGLWDDWVRLLYADKAVDEARLVVIPPNKPNEDLLVINPEHRLPALADRELLVTGERAIAEYLDERYPHPRLLPGDPADRARVRMAMDRFAAELFPVLAAAQVPKAPARATKALAELVQQSGRWFGARGYFIGAEFSQADCAWIVWLKGAALLKIAMPVATLAYVERLAKRKSVAAYLKAAP